MIEEADFQKTGNAAIDLCVFVEKLCLGKKHREEANKLTHNVLNLIKQTGKIKEEPLTKGNEIKKKLRIQFWRAEKALSMQILEQEGEFEASTHVRLSYSNPWIESQYIFLIGKQADFDKHVSTMRFNNNKERDEYLNNVIRWISEEQFGKNNEEMLKPGELKIGEMCEVRNGESEKWRQSKLITILPEKYDERFIVEVEDHPTEHYSWTYARPIVKRIEPKIEECGQLVTYTWEEK